MSKDTGIQWCDSTVNPTMGCDGCELWTEGRPFRPAGNGVPAVKGIPARKTCYAGAMHRRYGRQKGYAPRFDKVTLFPGRMLEAAKWKDLAGTDRPEKAWLNGMPRTIFVSDMSDSLSKAVPFEYLKEEIIDIAGSMAIGGGRHCWLWLTKRPTRMAEFARWLLEEHGVEWPRNVWAMTSVTSEATLGRIDALMNVGDAGTLRAVSIEPLGGPIRLKAHLQRLRERLGGTGGRYCGLDWAVLGGESEQEMMGPAGRAGECHERHLVDLAEQLVELGMPYFVKQLGSRFVGLSVRGKLQAAGGGPVLQLQDHHGGDWREWEAGGVNELLRVRRMPAWPKGAA